jgi:hypothetical protein
MRIRLSALAAVLLVAAIEATSEAVSPPTVSVVADALASAKSALKSDEVAKNGCA